jgi:hypothetical protein
VKVSCGTAYLASSSFALRRRERSRLGLFLAVSALLAQIAGPGLHPRALIGSANGVGRLAIVFDQHALCLAPDSAVPDPSTPADKSPKHHDFAACCSWHGSVSAVLSPAALVEPAVFAAISIAFAAPPTDLPTRKSGTAQARAPPPRA